MQVITNNPNNEIRWYVAHTRPRCEKKLADFCVRESLDSTLPTYRSVRKYLRKKMIFEKPLFPGYVFLRIREEDRRKVYNSDFIANLIYVTEQDIFQKQLEDILFALEPDVEMQVRLAPSIAEGTRVKVRYGPLQGMEGWVERRKGMVEVLLRLDFIGQAAAMVMDAENLEPT